MNSKKAKAFISNNLKVLFLSISIGLFACAISIFAFSSPGSNQPPNGNPIFWLLSGTSMYYTAGNVGIGTASPSTTLQVMGMVTASSVSAASQMCLSGGCQSYLATGGTLTNITTYTSNSTWTKPANLVYITVEIWGGAGGGGGTTACGSYIGGGGGGGAGGYALKVLTASQLGSTETITIGTSGVGGGSTGSGGTGGASLFTYNSGANTITANGGAGGTAGYANGDGTGGGGGGATGGDFNITGADGNHGTFGLCGSSMVEGGKGGDAPRGGAGGARPANGIGVPGNVPGGGGEGAGGGNNYGGGAGATGEVVIYQYTK